jgi:hypothetical protein
MVAARLIPEQHELFSVLFHWHEVTPAILLHRLLLVPIASCIELSMTHPRGRPRRGAPWKPRQPSVMPPDSTSTESSPRQQTKSPPVSLQVLHFNSMAVIPSTPISTLQLSLDPLAYPSNPMPFHDPLGDKGGDPPLHGESKREAPSFSESFDRARVKESLSALHDLAFELRQEVTDLNYRLQATDAKVTSFLRIISSLHEALLYESDETSPLKDSQAAKDADQREVPRPVEEERKKDAHGEDAKGAEHNEDVGKQWDDGLTYIEEEPWPGDLCATWSGYQPGV